MLNITFKMYFKYFRYKVDCIYSFCKPHIDRCDTCTELEVKLAADPMNLALKRQQEVHLGKWKEYKRLKRLVLAAGERSIAFEFNYAQNIPLPKLNNTAQFYR